jgi:hypothetical protein
MGTSEPVEPTTPPAALNTIALDKNQYAAIVLRKATTMIRRIMFTQVAVPHKRAQRDTIIRQALREAIGDVPTDRCIKNQLKRELVGVMMRTRLAFRSHARDIIEIAFDLLPDVMSGIDEVAHKREAVKTLLQGDDLHFLHRVDQLPSGTRTYYFERKAVIDLIVHVVWKVLKCGHLLDEANMDPVFALVGAAFKTELMKHSTGVCIPSTNAESFTEAYDMTIDFITTVIRADETCSERYDLLCKAIVERGRKQWSDENSDDDSDDDDDDDSSCTIVCSTTK